MADLGVIELVAICAPGAASLALSSWQALAKRNVDHLDKSLDALSIAIGDLRAAVKNVGDELGKQIIDLRLMDVSQAKDIGGLIGKHEGLERRIDGQGQHYQARFEKILEKLEALK